MITLPPLVRGQSRIPDVLAGRWRVVRQTVLGDGVQAYGNDDPGLVGTELVIAADGAAWQGDALPLKGRCGDAFFDGETSGAALKTLHYQLARPLRAIGASERGLRDLRFLCMSETADWGPDQEQMGLLLLADGRIAVNYFDNLLLLLEKSAPS